MFTSGSTGEPKGVVITLGGLASFLGWMASEQGFAPAETFLDQAPYSFDLSIMDLYVSLLAGGTLASLTRDDIGNPRQLYRALSASGVHNWVSTPSFAGMCLAEPGFSRRMLPEVRRFLFCGETLAAEIAGRLLDRFPGAEVWNTYGPTEATVATTSIRIDREILLRYPDLPIGYAMPGTRVLVLDDAGRPVGSGERGELVIVGPNVSPGYVNRPDLTGAAFYENDGMRAYRTGDRGYSRDGMLFYSGRIDSQIKLHGYRIEIGDIEANLRTVSGVRDAVVLPVSKPNTAASLVAFVVLSPRPPGSDFALSCALRNQLAERLPAYMVPRRFYVLDSFPLTSNGKADRGRLADSVA
jgi:D-alanine--poly(phosphoribitol) ligase subunit 1